MQTSPLRRSFVGLALTLLAGALPVARGQNVITRTISPNYVLTPHVSVVATPDPTAGTWSVQETLPTGLTASNVSGYGWWDSGSRTLNWGPFMDPAQRTCTYDVSGPVGTYTLSGYGDFGGVPVTTGGTTTLVIAQPEIEVKGAGQSIGDGDTTPSTADDTDFGTAVIGTPVTHVFTVRNTGGAPLTLGSVSVPTGYTLTEGLTATLAANASDTFSVRLNATATGVYAGDVSFTNGDPDESPYNFRITGTVAAPEIAITGNDQSITSGDTTPDSADGTDYGETPLGTPVSRTFTVTNAGGATLDLGVFTITVIGAYSLTEGLPLSLAPGVSDSFTVQLDATAVGTFTTDLRLASNDPDENPFVFRVTGTVTAPDIFVLGNGSEIEDGDTTPDMGDGTNLGSTPRGTPVAATFTVTNTGTGALALGTLTVPDGYTVAEPLAASLAPSVADTFTVRLDATAAGTYTGDVSIANNDPDEAPYTFRITGVVTEQEIAVTGQGHDITSGDTAPTTTDGTDLGSTPCGTPVASTFMVANAGTVTLTLGTPIVPAGYTVTEPLAPSLAPGVADVFTVRLDATVAGTCTGDVSIASNDADENPFVFRITGTVTGPAITLWGNGLSIAAGDSTPSPDDGTDFGETVVGTTDTHTFTIRNPGTDSLMVTAVSSSLTDFAVSGISLPASVAAGASATFTVSFTPTLQEARTATLELTNSTVPTPVYRVALGGMGVGPLNAPPVNQVPTGWSVRLLRDPAAVAGPANPTDLCAMGNRLFFAATGDGAELWRSDGTDEGTVVAANINRTMLYFGAFGYEGSSWPSNLEAVDGRLYLSADDGVCGRELWSSSGTGAELVRDMAPGGMGGFYLGSSPRLLTPVLGKLFLVADAAFGLDTYPALWVSDGTEGGTTALTDLLTASSALGPDSLTAVGNTLFFCAASGLGGRELWKSNGTLSGTVMVKDIRAGAGGSAPASLVDVGGTLFFAADDGVVGAELWKSNGSEGGTVRVADLRPGAEGSAPGSPRAVNGTLFFAADDGVHGRELWRSDGTADGTTLVADIRVGASGSDPASLTAVGGTLFFVADNGVHGRELWKSDGTADGTTLVADVWPAGSADPGSLTAVDDALFFVADDGVHGRELWVSDGTAAGTTLVADVRPGSASSGPARLTAVEGSLFFTADDGAHGTGRTGLWTARPPTQTVDPGGALVFNNSHANRITISDPDAGDLDVRVQLSMDHGTLTLPRTTGLAIAQGDGTQDAAMTFTGSLANINAALDGLTYRPADYAGPATLTLTTDDLGHTGSGGARQDTDTVSIDVLSCEISGRITNGAEPVAGVTLSGFPREPVLTDADGAYVATVPGNWSGTVTPAKANHAFAPVSRAYAVVRANVAGQDYGSTEAMDYGDAPWTAAVDGGGFWFGNTWYPLPGTPASGYPVRLAQDGARHRVAAGPWLGATIDYEADGAQSSAATGDGADEDGVTVAVLAAGLESVFTVTVSGAAGKLDAWIDWNVDSDWNDAGEQVAASLDVGLGDNALAVTPPAGAVVGTTFARFRLSTAGGLAPTGRAQDGEVEDYQVTVATPDTPEIDVTAGGVGIVDGDTTPGSTDGTDFGQAPVGTPVTRTFTVASCGTGTLVLGPPTVPAGYTVTDPLAESLAPGAADTFAVRLDATAAGTFAGDVTIATNDGDENPFSFRVAGIVVTVPEIAVSGNGQDVASGDTTPSAEDGTNFGQTPVGVPVIRTFTVSNPGTATLTLGTPTVPSGYTVTDAPAASLAPGTADTFSVRLGAAAPGTCTGQVSLATNDDDEDPFVFAVTGTVVTLPGIAIAGNGLDIADGDTTPSPDDHTDFGPVPVSGGTSTRARVFTIRNSGSAALTVGDVAVSGDQAGDFVVSGLALPATLAAGDSASFAVAFDPSAEGPRTATVEVTSNATGAVAYRFAIQGEGTAAQNDPPVNRLPAAWVVRLVGDPLAAAGPVSPTNLCAVGRTLFLAAEDAGHGRELWTSDGSAAGTVRVKDIHPTGDSNPGSLTAMNGTLYFGADDGTPGGELWRSDGTEAGTVLVKDIIPEGGWSPGPHSLTNADGMLFLAARNPWGVFSPDDLWVSDGTMAGTVMLTQTGSFATNNPRRLTNVDGTLFYVSSLWQGAELWRSDGTAAGTAMVADIRPGGGSSDPQWLTSMGGRLFFTADNGSGEGDKRELWVSDDTAGGTHALSDYGRYGSADPSRLTAVHGTLFFRARHWSGSYGYELWKSDGTSSGSGMVTDLRAGAADSNPDCLTAVGSTLFLTADDGMHGVELWRSDGSAEGTVLVADINPAGNSSPGSLTNVDGTLFFTADDGSHGVELWRSDGTAAGTAMVADVGPGAAGSSPQWLTAVDGALFFTADDGVHGRGLWRAAVPSAAQGGSLVFSDAEATGIAVSDPDIGGAEVEVQLGVDHGTLTLSGTAGLTFSQGDGTDDATMTFTGTLASVNAALDGLAYRPADFLGTATLTLRTDDLGHTGSGGPRQDQDSVAIVVAALGYVVSGSVTGDAGPLGGVTLVGFPDGPLMTSPDGTYRARVPGGWSGTITPQKELLTFEPESRTYAAVAADQPGQDYAGLAPEIEVLGDGNPIADGDTAASLANLTDFGPVGLDQADAVHVFSIRNSGSGPLPLLGPTPVALAGAEADGFSVRRQPDSPVAPGSTTTFEIVFAPHAAKASQATVSIASADADENPFEFVVQGTGVPAPDIELVGNGQPIACGDLEPTPIDGTDFGAVPVDHGVIVRVFALANRGPEPLHLTGSPAVAITGADSADFAVTFQPWSPVSPGGLALLEIAFSPTAAGPRTATVSIASDDADETPYLFAICGTGADAARIEVRGHDRTIAPGDSTPSLADHTDFGSAAVGGPTAPERTFTIRNAGSAPLHLTGSPAVTIAGPEVADFAVTVQPSSPLAPGATTSFRVAFTPGAVGPSRAVVSVASDDTDRPAYEFAIQGTGTVRDTSWRFRFDVFQADGTPWYADGWEAGMEGTASDGFDTDLDVTAPPATADSSSVCWLIDSGQTGLDRLQTDIRPFAEAAVWRLVVALAPGAEARITWDRSRIPPGRRLLLQAAAEDWTGSGPVLDLASADEYSLANSSRAPVTRRFLVSARALVEYALPLLDGWNLVSLPVEPDDGAVASVLATPEARGVVYSGEVWEWDTAQQQYRSVQTLRPLVGYWVFVTTPGPVVVRGTLPASTGISLTAGWNLVGVPADGVAAPDQPPVIAPTWWWDAGSYDRATELDRGLGYWIYTQHDTVWELDR